MADSVRQVTYFYVKASNRPGQGARYLAPLAKAGVNLLGFSGFPLGRTAQVDFVPEKPAAFRKIARREGWKVVGPRRAFVVQGGDRPGAIGRALDRLAKARVNVTACQAVGGGKGRYGAMIWVKKRDLGRARRALGAR